MTDLEKIIGFNMGPNQMRLYGYGKCSECGGVFLISTMAETNRKEFLCQGCQEKIKDQINESYYRDIEFSMHHMEYKGEVKQ